MAAFPSGDNNADGAPWSGDNNADDAPPWDDTNPSDFSSGGDANTAPDEGGSDSDAGGLVVAAGVVILLLLLVGGCLCWRCCRRPPPTPDIPAPPELSFELRSGDGFEVPERRSWDGVERGEGKMGDGKSFLPGAAAALGGCVLAGTFLGSMGGSALEGLLAAGEAVPFVGEVTPTVGPRERESKRECVFVCERESVSVSVSLGRWVLNPPLSKHR